MKRLFAALLCIALALPAGMPVEAQFPFPVGHYSSGEVVPQNPGCCGTNFDSATPDYLSHTNSSGWTDSNKFTFSFWVKRDRSGTTERIFDVSDSGASGIVRFAISFLSSDVINVLARDSDGTSTFMCNFEGSTAFTDTNWHHVIISVDLSSTSNRYMYVDDVAETLSVTTYDTGGEFDFTGTTYRVAHFETPAVPFDGSLSEVWFEGGTFIDFSTTSNRRDFIDASGDPVDLDSDGSTPTGSAPEVYMSDADGTNTGTTANYSQTGSPTSVDGPNP